MDYNHKEKNIKLLKIIRIDKLKLLTIIILIIYLNKYINHLQLILIKLKIDKYQFIHLIHLHSLINLNHQVIWVIIVDILIIAIKAKLDDLLVLFQFYIFLITSTYSICETISYINIHAHKYIYL
jgi:hypothetical protein